MKPSSGDRLDALALRVVQGGMWRRRPASRCVAESAADHAPEDRFSRTSALKLAVVAAASLTFGLWRAPAVRADPTNDCIAGCVDAYDEYLRLRYVACGDGYTRFVRGGGPWRTALVSTLTLGYSIPRLFLYVNCRQKAREETNQLRRECVYTCERVCRKRATRSLQTANGATQECKPLPPPRKKPPASFPPPPAPPKADICLECMSVGGECCDGGGGQVCCAPKGITCERVGCKSGG